jgi:hypothetical protein
MINFITIINIDTPIWYQDISGPGHLGTEHMRHLGTGNFGTE